VAAARRACGAAVPAAWRFALESVACCLPLLSPYCVPAFSTPLPFCCLRLRLRGGENAGVAGARAAVSAAPGALLALCGITA